MAVLICMALGIACLLYYIVIIFYAGITADFAWIWLLFSAVLEGSAGLIRYGLGHPGFFPRWLCRMAGIFLLAGCLLFFLLCWQIIREMTSSGSPNLDYVVILGAQVKGELPSKALHKRLEKAREYVKENESTVLILSGGQGSGENITEAECMRRWLTEQGISEKRMILEERSTNTRENLEFSHKLTGCGGKRTGILSNDFHVYRAVRLAEKLGYEQAEGIAAPSDPIMEAHYVLREVFALIKEKLVGNI